MWDLMRCQMYNVLVMLLLWVEQVFLMSQKHISQKRRRGRDFLKETIMIPFFILSFVAIMFSVINSVELTTGIYSVHNLPPLSASGMWGIFSPTSRQNKVNNYISVQELYYSPDDHPGVNNLIASLVAEYPSIKASGFANPEEIIEGFQTGIYSVWAAIEFNLTTEQIQTGSLVVGELNPSSVDYTILINENFVSLPTDLLDNGVYNAEQCDADKWWTSGYMTLQNFVSTYLTRQYSFASEFKVL